MDGMNRSSLKGDSRYRGIFLLSVSDRFGGKIITIRGSDEDLERNQIMRSDKGQKRYVSKNLIQRKLRDES